MAALMIPQAPNDDPGDRYVADRHLWLTADRQRVVEDGDPEAAFLLAAAGVAVPSEEVERLGLAGKDARKQAARVEDKQAERAEDKGQARRRRGKPDDAGR